VDIFVYTSDVENSKATTENEGKTKKKIEEIFIEGIYHLS
jgi:hypothetical protein